MALRRGGLWIASRDSFAAILNRLFGDLGQNPGDVMKFYIATSRRVALAVRYAEGARDLVEGSVALRYTPTSWFSLQAGPHARHYGTLSGPERVVTWRLGGRGDFALVGSSVRGHAMLWRALALAVNLPPGSGSGSASGGEVGLTLDLGPRPVWFALAYGIDQAQVKGASWRADVNTLTLTAGLRRR